MFELLAWIGGPAAAAGVLVWLCGGVWASRRSASVAKNDLNARMTARELPSLVMAIGLVAVGVGVVIATPWWALHHVLLGRFALVYGLAILFCVRMLWPGNRYLRRSMSIDINRTPSDVAAFLADGRNAVSWQGPLLQSMTVVSGEPGAEGSVYHGVVVLNDGEKFEADARLDEYRPGQMLVWRDVNDPGPVSGTEIVTLEQQAGGTHLTRLVSEKYEWRDAIIQTWEDPFGSNRRQQGKDMVARGNANLAKLKAVLESGPPAP